MNESSTSTQQAFNRKLADLQSEWKAEGAVGPAEVREGLPYYALESLSDAVGLTPEALAPVLHVSERTLQRRRHSGRLSASESDRLWRVSHIYHLALEAFEGRTEEATQWLTTPKQVLGGDTPIEHLDTEPGARAVEQILAVIDQTMPA